MKVLLLGEFSGFHTNLKKGLEELGVDCKIASTGDVWKKIGTSDIRLFRTDFKNPLDKFYKLILEPLIGLDRFYGFDVVQMVNPIVFSPYIDHYIVKRLIANNKKVFTALSGDCYNLYNAYKKGLLGYYIYDDNPEDCAKFETGKHASKYKEQEEYIFKHVNGIIPVMYEYSVGLKDYTNCKKSIPLPIDASTVEYKDNVLRNDKLTIMHGVIREKYKGTKYILEALDIIKKKYPNDVEIIVDGKLPLKEYLKVLSRTNILVDQCKEHGWSMNACYGMAQGKVVLSGASVNTLADFGLERSPIVHIEPNVNQIVSQLEQLIENRSNITEYGYESRKFVETFHSHVRVAQLYMDTWLQKS